MGERRHGRRWWAALGLGLVLAVAPTAARAATLAPGFWTQALADGLGQPVAVDWLPDGRMLVAEKPGEVLVVHPDGTVDPKPLIDWSDEVNDYLDRGLLDVAAAPDFATSGEVYVVYVRDTSYLRDPSSGQDSPAPEVSRLSRITIGPDGTAGPEHVVLDSIPAEGISHTIGTVRADPDGTLWMGTGDAASFNKVDPLALGSQDEDSLRGKILHVDRDGRGLPGHPFCPADTNLDDTCTKVYAKGFRNPFRFGLRSGGGPFVGDVGWNSREELDLVQAGGDYGWPCYEGTIHTPGYADLADCQAEYTREGTAAASLPPAYDYDHGTGNTAIGGFAYNGSGYPSSRVGQLVFGDYGHSYLRFLDLGASGGPAAQPLADHLTAVDLEPAPDNGDVVYVGYSSLGVGTVGRIVYSPDDGPPTAKAGADVTSGASPLTVNFDGGQSSDPDNDELKYHWEFGDGGPGSDEASPAHVYSKGGVYSATLRVSDPDGLVSRDRLTIAVDDRPPVATIDAPKDGDTYADGDQVQLRGSADDPEEGPLTGARLSWDIVLFHGNHTHTLASRTGPEPVFVAQQDHDADSYYQVTLTATDSAGLTDSKSVVVRPRTVPFELDSVPPGAPVTYAGLAQVAPWQTTSADGFITTISAADSFVVDGRTYEFDRWSDDGERVHDITIPPNPGSRTAYYREVGQPTPTEGDAPPPAEPPPPPPDLTAVFAPAELPAQTDFRGPRISLSRVDARRGQLSGRASDGSGVASLEVALRTVRGVHSSCRWWWPARHRLLRRSACGRPVWFEASVRKGRWTIRLGRRLPRGRYVVLLRARDSLGNLSRASAATRATT